MREKGLRVEVVDRLQRDLEEEERIMAALEAEIGAERETIRHIEADVLDLRDAIEARVVPAAEPASLKQPPAPRRERPLRPIVTVLVVLAIAISAVVIGVLVDQNAGTTTTARTVPAADTRWTAKQQWAAATSVRTMPTMPQDTRWIPKQASAPAR
jgi:hypothetical protein